MTNEPAVEIRAKVGAPDLWEVVSSHRCCIFEWKKDKHGRGTIRIDETAHDGCKREIADYARLRAFRVAWASSDWIE
jgi:hypothetical protein